MNEQPSNQPFFAPYQATGNRNTPSQPVFPIQTPPPKKPVFRTRDMLFAWLSIPMGYFFVRLLPLSQSTLGGMLMIWAMFLFGGVYFRLSGIRPNSSSICLAVCAGILSLGLITGGNAMIRAMLYLLLIGVYLFWAYATCGLAGKNPLSPACLHHATHLFSIPIPSVHHLFLALIPAKGNAEKRRATLRTLGWCALGLLVAVLPTAVIVTLLSYDERFTGLLHKIFSFSIDGFGEFIRDLFFGIAVAALLFASLSAFLRRREENNEAEEALTPPSCHILPRALLCAAVTPILAVYVIFFVSQWQYYVSAFSGVLPSNTVYSAYARSGFFELCWVCAINAAILLVFNLLIRKTTGKTDPLRRIYSSVISLFTLVLIATALSKMALYINSYGLTRLRVYASWFMLLLASIFVLVLLKQCISRINLAGAAVVCVLIFTALIALPDIDGMIADYNVNAYLSEELSDVDVYTLREYGASAAPALNRLIEALESTDAPLTEDQTRCLSGARAALNSILGSLSEQPEGFFAFNLPAHRARKLLGER